MMDSIGCRMSTTNKIQKEIKIKLFGLQQPFRCFSRACRELQRVQYGVIARRNRYLGGAASCTGAHQAVVDIQETTVLIEKAVLRTGAIDIHDRVFVRHSTRHDDGFGLGIVLQQFGKLIVFGYCR